MLLVASLAPFFLLATYVVAKPVFTRGSSNGVPLQITGHLNVNGTRNVIQNDQARAAKFANQFSDLTSPTILNLPLNDAGVTYATSIGIGQPPTYYYLVIDTGSANTWVGANKPYGETQTSVKTSNSVKVTYGSGSIEGTEYTDTVTIAQGVVITQQSIGIASQSHGFYPFDGILGIGPTDLTLHSLSPDSEKLIPTVTDNLYKQGVINEDLISVSFQPTTSASTAVTNGELIFGGVDTRMFVGNITFFPLTRSCVSCLFWGVDGSFQYGGATIMAAGSGIIDTGTTQVLLASDAFTSYISATGAAYDNHTGLYTITTEQYQNLESLFFQIGDSSFELTRNAQIIPRILNSIYGGSPNRIYLVVGDLGSIQGLDFICGMTFLQRYYSVYDSANQRVGLAATPFTYANTN